MKKTFKLTIENPCHEKWEKMHVNASGKFCDSCQKNVIDFTNKSPREIAQIISEANGKACGRFKSLQLEQEYSVITTPRNDTNWYKSVAASFLLMLGVKTTHAQDPSVKTPLVITEKRETPLLIGDTVVVEQKIGEKIFKIEGQLLDAETGESIPFRKIYYKDKISGTVSDIDGKFTLKITPNDLGDSIQIVVGGLEYKELYKIIHKFDFNEENKLFLNFYLTLAEPIEYIEIMGIIVVEPKRIKKTRKKGN